LFAAAAPVCSGGDASLAKAIKDVPVWVFHGDADGVVKVRRSRDMIAALKAAGGAPKYTEYPGVGHDSWTATYRDPELYRWLFAQKRATEP
jgi:predicted peptidase